MKTPLIATLALALLFTADPLSAAEDEFVFQLASGGQIRGKWLNAKERGRDDYHVQTASGGRITLAKQQVKQVTRKLGREVEYEKIAPTFPDTVQGQMELAEWCRKNLLSSARKVHLERVIQLDPDHAEARRLLGFQNVNDQWLTRADIMKSRGYVKDGRGRWVLPQQIQLAEERRRRKQVEREWFRELSRLRKALSGDKWAEARARLLEIRNPYAVAAVAHYKDPEREQSPKVRELFVDVLGNIGGAAARDLLVDAALFDPDKEVRYAAIDRLSEKKHPAAVRACISQLTANQNKTINRAAIVLGDLGDPTAIGPLINALISTHIYIKKSGGGGGITGTFDPRGASNGSLSAGSKTEVVKRSYRNESVRNALVKLSGGTNFNYNVDQWKSWWAIQKKSRLVDVRRD